MDTKLTGDISVYRVVTELLKKDKNVLMPVGDRLPYDIAIDNCGKLIRLQIRTAYYFGEKDNYVGSTKSCKTNRKRYKLVKSNTDDVEFFIFVICDRESFYIAPSDVIKQVGFSVTLVPHRNRNVDKYQIEKFKDNWDALQL